jgi:uncharacterized protein (DUF305 family)
MLALLLAACGASSHNEADTAFAAAMVPHHALGVRMADTAVSRADNVLVRRIAFKMLTYQQGELRSLERWATRWNAKAPEHVHGMLTAEEEARLNTRRGADFDRQWLTEMIRHHEGAVQMAEAEARNGANSAERRVAERIVNVQTEQIAQMHELLTLVGTP